MKLVSAEILDERTEENCLNRICTWEQTQNKRFTNYNGELRTFDYILNKAIVDKNGNINFEFRNNNNLTLKPFGILSNGEKKFVEDLPEATRNQLNYKALIKRDRDNANFGFSFNKLQSLDFIGLQLETTFPVSTVSYNYTPEGIYDESNFTEYQVLDLVIKDKRISFTDLIDTGYNISFNKSEKEMYIDLRGRSGFIDLDPLILITSEATDGDWTIEEPNTCTDAINTSTTGRISDSHTLSPAIQMEGALNFNTSSIPNSAIITQSQIILYRHLFTTFGSPSVTWDVTYLVNNYYFGESLDCTDRTGALWNNIGSNDWEGNTGLILKGLNTDFINKTGYVALRLLPGWEHLASGKSATAYFRSSEYGSDEPLLRVFYQVPGAINITWESPTPANDGTINQDSVTLNATVESNNLTSAWFDFNKSLVGYWSFDYNFGGVIHDNSTFNNTGYFSGSVSPLNITNGKFGAGLEMGTNNNKDRISVKNNESINITNDELTISAWVKPNFDETHDQFRYILDKRGGSSNDGGYRFAFFQNIDDYRFRLSTTSGTSNCDTAGITITPNQWYHLVARYNSTTMNIYIDTSEEASCSATGNITGNSYNLSIGNFGTGALQMWNGTLDEVIIWNRALSEQEIGALYNNTANRLFNTFSDLELGQYNYSAYAIDKPGNLEISTQSFTYSLDEVLPIQEKAVYPLIIFFLMFLVAIKGVKNEQEE